MIVDLESCRKEVTRYRIDWKAEKINLDKTIAECSRDHATPVDGYWQAERTARLRLQLAESLLLALEGANGEVVFPL